MEEKGKGGAWWLKKVCLGGFIMFKLVMVIRWPKWLNLLVVDDLPSKTAQDF